MIPHLLDAPAIPGPSPGRGVGLNGAVDLAEVALGAAALRASRALLPAEDALAAGRFRDDLAWIRTHSDDVEASNAKNNHGTYGTLPVACPTRLRPVPFEVITGLAAALPTKDDPRLNCALPDGRCLVPRLALLAPCMADKDAWWKMFSSLPTPPPHRPTRRSRSSPT